MEKDDGWSYADNSQHRVPTLSSGLEPGSHFVHEGTTLLSHQQLRGRLVGEGTRTLQGTLVSGERVQLNTGLRGHTDPNTVFKDRLMTYQDSGFSEEDADHQVTTCLMKTPSGSIYIQPTSQKMAGGLDTRLDSHYSQPGYSTSRLQPKDGSDSDRSTTQLKPHGHHGTLTSSLASQAKPGINSFTKDLPSCSSWRAVAIFFIVLTIAMASTLAFVIASTLVTPSETEIAKACAVVDTGSQAAMNMVTTEERSYKELSPPVPDSRESRLPDKFSTRNFPPDGTTFQQVSLGQKVAVTIPPFGYLNIQFFHEEASYVTLTCRFLAAHPLACTPEETPSPPTHTTISWRSSPD